MRTNTTGSRTPAARIAAAATGHAPPARSHTLAVFAAAALGIGASSLLLSTLITPGAPFLLASVYLGLVTPALVLTHRESGGAGVRALLRDCVRLPRTWWWLPLAGFALPTLTWCTGALLGGAAQMDWGLVTFFVTDLIVGALVINIWEEMAWTGFFQRRATSRWGAVGGSLVTSIFFTGIHVPLAFDGADGAHAVATNLLFIAGVAVGVRLLVARIDPWSGYSLLTIGVLHSSFNASESMLEADHDWVRIAVTIAAGIGVAALGAPTRSDG